MADNFYAKYSANEPATVVTSLNTQSGALTLVAGTGVSITPGSGTLTISAPENGTVTSVAMSVPAFLSVAGSPVTSSGTLAVTLSGTALPIANGGTGQTTAPNAINALLPTQTSHSGEFLTTNGTVASWAAVSGGANTALSNLASVAINTTLLPSADNTIGLGSPAKRFDNGYIVTLKDSSDVASVKIQSRTLTDAANQTSINWSTREMSSQDGTVVADYSRTDRTRMYSLLTLLQSASDPSGPVAGSMYYNTTINKPEFYNGTFFESLSTNATGMLQATYDFAILGGGVGELVLKDPLGGAATIPAGSYVTDAALFCDTTVTGGLTSSVGITVGPEADGNSIRGQDTVGSFAAGTFSSTYQADGNIGITGRSQFFIKATTAQTIRIQIYDEALTAGKLTLRITYLPLP